MVIRFVVCSLILIIAQHNAAAAPVGTAFTYQGQLKQSGAPANGSYDFEFRLFDLAESGVQQGPLDPKSDVAVENGLITVNLDFGSVFDGNQRWLEVRVRDGASTGAFTPLTPRQELTAAPYALAALGGPAGSGLWQSSAANIFNTNAGNVGVGTTDPHHRLRISGGPVWTSNGWTGSLELDNAAAIGWQGNTGGQRFGIGQSNGGLFFFRTGSDPGATGSPANYDMVINDAGNVGIGATTPAYPLTIQTPGGNFAASYGWVHTNGTVEVGSYLSASGGWLGTRSNHPLYFFTNDSSPQVTLTTAGALGIGTSSVPAGVKLAVDGKILCEEMEVQLSGDWPDYVFEETYDLMPFSDLEKAVEKEKHLPGIPSAADVAKNGVKVGQMQAQLVEKIEELTLYMIQMNKQLERVERENTELKMRLATLEGNR